MNKKRIINPTNREGQTPLCHTLKANYYKMGVHDFLFTKQDGFSATGVLIEYA